MKAAFKEVIELLEDQSSIRVYNTNLVRAAAPAPAIITEDPIDQKKKKKSIFEWITGKH